MTRKEKQSVLLSLALLEVGTKENPPNSNRVKYNDWFYLTEKEIKEGMHAEGKTKAWCAVFYSWLFAHAKISLPVIDYSKGMAGVYYALHNVNKWGRFVTQPELGDAVFYDFNGDGKFEHVGMYVEKLTDIYFRAIEGNTAFGNDSNGGEVIDRRDRKYGTAIFVRPFILEDEGLPKESLLLP